MINRKKVLIIFGIIYIIFATSLYFGIKKIKKNFSMEKLNLMLTTTSAYRDKTDDLCKYGIKGDPIDVGKKYLKINFWCINSRDSRNTISLEALNDRTVSGALIEYARIIGFDYQIIKEKNWICLLNDQIIVDYSTTLMDAATIDCFENENILKSIKKNI